VRAGLDAPRGGGDTGGAVPGPRPARGAGMCSNAYDIIHAMHGIMHVILIVQCERVPGPRPARGVTPIHWRQSVHVLTITYHYMYYACCIGFHVRLSIPAQSIHFEPSFVSLFSLWSPFGPSFVSLWSLFRLSFVPLWFLFRLFGPSSVSST
jgi:hypothetical protein